MALLDMTTGRRGLLAAAHLQSGCGWTVLAPRAHFGDRLLCHQKWRLSPSSSSPRPPENRCEPLLQGRSDHPSSWPARCFPKFMAVLVPEDLPG